MPQQLLDHLGMLALRQQQRRGGVAKRVEGVGWQASTLQERAVHVGEQPAGLHGPAERVRERQPEVLPQVAGRPALLLLTCSVPPQRRHRRWRQHHPAARRRRLRSADPEPLTGAAKGAADPEHTLVKVHVLPAEGEQLAAAHAGLEREHEQHLEAVAGRGGQERPGLLYGEGDDLDMRLARWPRERHHVPWHQAPADGLGEGAVQDGVQVADRGGGQAGGELLLVEPLEVLWGEPGQPDPAERRNGVDANVLLVAFEGARGDRVLDDGEPFGEERRGAAVGGHGLAFGAGFEQLLELGGGVLAAARPAHDAPAVVHDERGDPAAVAGALVDRAFALAASPGCHAAASRRSRATYSWTAAVGMRRQPSILTDSMRPTRISSYTLVRPMPSTSATSSGVSSSLSISSLPSLGRGRCGQRRGRGWCGTRGAGPGRGVP